MRAFLLIPRLKIHSANALSSPFTIGFPAMSAWLGAMHALQRQLNQQGLAVTLSRLAVSCHTFDLQTRTEKMMGYIRNKAHPLTQKGERPTFIEEARCHLEVSLLIECEQIDSVDQTHLEEQVDQIVWQMKFASGDVIQTRPSKILHEDERDPQSLKTLINHLMLGHILIERRELIQQAQQEGCDALDALLDCLTVQSHATLDREGKVVWKQQRKHSGWLVPIAVGFQGISPLGHVANQRDVHTPHRFAESVVTLGEFILPIRINHIDEMLWQYQPELERNLYLCTNH